MSAKLNCSAARAAGEEQREADGQVHVGRAELRLDRAVFELDHRVYHRLRVDQHRDSFGRHPEEPAGFDHFESLVDERRRIDRDLGSHAPLRVSQGLFDSHFGEPLARYVAQCTARTGDDQPPRGRRFAHQTLEDG